MRLRANEIEIIKSTVLKQIGDATIILFGSRADDSRRGGDIDLLVKTGHRSSLNDKLKILTDLERNGIMRKVDLLIQTPYTKEQAIFKTAEEEGVLL